MSIDKQARDVSRYDLVSGYMQRWPDGEFIYHSDYLELLDELEAAERRNADLEELLDAEVRLWTQRYDCANSRREAAEKRSAELSDSHSKLRETMAAIHNTIKQDGFSTPLAVIMQNAKRAHEESAAAAGITVKGE